VQEGQMKRSSDSVDRASSDAIIIDSIGLVQRVVNQVAQRYPRHVDREELWNAGACGLVEAARRYRPETGVPFARYASMRIRGAIIDSSRGRDWMTRRARRDLRELRGMEDSIRGELGRLPDDEELAAGLNIGVAELRARRAADVAATVLYLDHEYEDADSLGEILPESRIDHLPEGALEEREVFGTLRTAVRNLPSPHRQVVERHYLRGERVLAIAESMNLSEARVSQICSEAINSIRTYLATMYEGLPEVAPNAPGKRSRRAFVESMQTGSTWRERLHAGDEALAV
jgi:RNA polymerase sigma factor for flagellar operon FliA